MRSYKKRWNVFILSRFSFTIRLTNRHLFIFCFLTENLPTEIQAELVAMKEGLSLSDDDTLNWRAFLAATVDKNLVMREDKIRYAFDHFVHGENKDYLTQADFDSIFEGDAQGREVFKFLDTNGDGKVLFEDFRRAMEESIDLENSESGTEK